MLNILAISRFILLTNVWYLPKVTNAPSLNISARWRFHFRTILLNFFLPSRLLFGRFFFSLSFDSIVASSLLKKVRYYLLLTLHQCTVFPNILCHISTTYLYPHDTFCISLALINWVNWFQNLRGPNFSLVFPYNFWKK